MRRSGVWPGEQQVVLRSGESADRRVYPGRSGDRPQGVRGLLEAEPDIRVIGGAGTASAALAQIPALRPDVALLDVRLPDGDGVSVCREVRSRVPQMACLMFTAFVDDQALLDSILAGAAGYVLKQVHGSDLVGAVRIAASGQSLLEPRAASPADSPAARRVWQARPAGQADRTRAQRPAAYRGGPDQPADRRAAVHCREDSEELRVDAVPQARPDTAYRGSRLRSPNLQRPYGRTGSEHVDHRPAPWNLTEGERRPRAHPRSRSCRTPDSGGP